MRAVTFRSFGGPDVLEIIDLPVPVPGPGQVRIRVEAAPAQPVDAGTRAGIYAKIMPGHERYTLGWDLAGTVDALGPDLSATGGFSVGDKVIGLSDWFTTHAGAQAEYAVLPVTALAAIPAGMSTIDASTLPLNALTAWQALDRLALPDGATLAVTGAAGAVGGFAARLAVLRGLRVVGIAGAQDEAAVRAQGAEWFVARSEDPARAVRSVRPDGVDAVFDPAAVGAPVIGAIRDSGLYLNAAPMNLPAAERGIAVSGLLVRSDGERLTSLAELASRGELSLPIAGTVAFEQAPTVHERLVKGGLRGRLVYLP